MANLLEPTPLRPSNEDGIIAYNQQRTAERTTAITAAAYLTHNTLDELLADADIILTWLRSDNTSLLPPTPDTAPDGASDGLDPLSAQEDPDGP